MDTRDEVTPGGREGSPTAAEERCDWRGGLRAVNLLAPPLVLIWFCLRAQGIEPGLCTN